MHSIVSFRSACRRLIACGAVLGAVAVSATPTLAARHWCDPSTDMTATAGCQPSSESNVNLLVSNPQPGELLPAAPYQLKGSVSDGSGQLAGSAVVDRIQVFIYNKNTGGKLLLGDAQIAPDGTWTATADLSGEVGSGILYVVARSSGTGAETTVGVPYMVPLSSPATR